MNPSALDQLIELARRRPLNDAELTRLNELLAASPQAWPDRGPDERLAQLLARLPDAPLASNFTMRVMAEIDRLNSHEAAPPPGARHWWRRWLPRLAGATTVAAVLAAGWWQYRTKRLADYAASVAAVSEVAAPLPDLELLKDFEAIHSFAHVPPGFDVEGDLSLLAALQ